MPLMNDRELLYRLSDTQRADLLGRITRHIERQADVSFAYALGSFLTEPAFHDIDIAVCLAPSTTSPRERALEVAEQLGHMCEIPMDVQPLNGAPLAFAFHALCGRLLFSRDDERLARMIEDTVSRYLDMEPLARRATIEAFAP